MKTIIISSQSMANSNMTQPNIGLKSKWNRAQTHFLFLYETHGEKYSKKDPCWHFLFNTPILTIFQDWGCPRILCEVFLQMLTSFPFYEISLKPIPWISREVPWVSGVISEKLTRYLFSIKNSPLLDTYSIDPACEIQQP